MKRLDWGPVERLAYDLLDCWQTRRQVFFVGNGGSGGNANHLANDLLYALSKTPGSGLCVHSLSANPSVITCLANDEGYEQVFSLQLAVLARKGDVLIALSGSGNSPNILNALREARKIGMTSYALLGYSGGKAKALADIPIHLDIDDMQISEDAQLIIGHMLMQWLSARRSDVAINREG
ncbi:SIS domain-containing protein [Bradyrhizobium betae]